ncbi:MAG TPA: LLM class F420-dependent oxidoreductase [Roseiflexaceae bacterium]|nr:LLM class F420-dependent oxidoreductase [Roseiflexaceae bacterium]
MLIGVTFPQTEIGSDPVSIKDYAQAAEDMGYVSILAYDHVLGASTATRPNWSGAYTSENPFHEPFVLFGYLAGVTRRVELVTGVLVLPQRQTALVAKQAAEVDVLSGGRLRLGVGVGWNAVEYQALGQDFHTRGRRCEEQIALLRALWAEPVVDFRGRWHTVEAAGINPLPVRRSIPIWIGGYAEETLRRVARMGDGWISFRPPDDGLRAQVERIHRYALEAGRDPEVIGLEGQLSLARVPEARWVAHADAWRALGARYMTVNTMGMGFTSPQQHIDALRRAADVLGVRKG